jgi:hypothetical protein
VPVVRDTQDTMARMNGDIVCVGFRAQVKTDRTGEPQYAAVMHCSCLIWDSRLIRGRAVGPAGLRLGDPWLMALALCSSARHRHGQAHQPPHRHKEQHRAAHTRHTLAVAALCSERSNNKRRYNHQHVPHSSQKPGQGVKMPFQQLFRVTNK